MVERTTRVVGGKYRLERQIGSGGMGSIWVAFDQTLQRRVAVKLMRPDQLKSAASRDNFAHEARAAAQFQHPNVVQTFDYGIDESGGEITPYIVMELLYGEDLSARLSTQKRLPLSKVVLLLTQLSRALLTAHGLGLIHRDLKPANLFLAHSDGKEVIKILDFGVAAMRAWSKEGETGAGLLVGTPQYMSPEQILDPSRVDHRADLYALGVVAYEALTGVLPFEVESLNALVNRATKSTESFRPPSQLVPELGPQVDSFFERALAGNPAQRFQSAREMAIALAALEESGQGKRAIRILVADDEPDLSLLIRQRFRQQIRKTVYDFLFAPDGFGALDTLRRTPDVDLVLSDINMPGMDGLSLLEHVADVNPIVKVVMVSAYGDMRNIREAMNRGAFDFLTKPIDFKDLEKTIEKTVQHVGAARRATRIAEEHALLRMFVSSGIADKLLPMLRSTDLTACEQVDATAVFILIRGFDWQAESLPDAALSAANALFETVITALAAQQGIVDKFVGNGLFAVFRGEDHLGRAIRACFEVRAALPATPGKKGGPLETHVAAAIGIDSGRVLAGGVGSRLHGRMDYTVLGDVVSTALRLVVMAESDQILCTETLATALQRSYVSQRLRMCELPGARTPQTVYNIMRETRVRGPDASSDVTPVNSEHAHLDTLVAAQTADDPRRSS